MFYLFALNFEKNVNDLGCLESHFWEALWASEAAQVERPRGKMAPRAQDQNSITNPKAIPWDWAEIDTRQKCFWTRELFFRLSSAFDAPAWCLGKVRAREARASPGKNLSAREFLVYTYTCIYIYILTYLL